MDTPVAYAKNCARYMTDASTIRVRTLEHFTKAPSVSLIADYIAKAQAPVRKAHIRAPQVVHLQDRTGRALDMRWYGGTWPGIDKVGKIAADIERHMGVKLGDITGPQYGHNVLFAREIMAVTLIATGSTVRQAGAIINRERASIPLHLARKSPECAAFIAKMVAKYGVQDAT
jgi:hypothetical protein